MLIFDLEAVQFSPPWSAPANDFVTSISEIPRHDRKPCQAPDLHVRAGGSRQS